MPDPKHAMKLNAGQLARLLKIIGATSKYPQRDQLVVLMGHCAGLRITEISRVTVADVLFDSGRIRSEVSLRSAVTKGCNARAAFFSAKTLIAALEAYLAHRTANDIGMDLGTTSYRGLLPDQPLIYSARGTGMSQNIKRRTLQTGERKDYPCADSLQSHVTVLYHRAGLNGSSHSGRRTFATKILAKTGDLDIVRNLLGHSDLACIDLYIQVSESTLSAMFENDV